jgi:membrane fusion protein (multidrug efflux system)
VTTAASESVPIIGNWVATTDGYVNAQIQPQVSGYLIRQDYTEGSEVHKNQVLFEIDPRPFQATLDQAQGQLDQAKGQLGQAQAQVQLAEINVQRDTPLAQAHAIAQSTLDNETKTLQSNQASVASAQAAIASAQAQVESAQLNLGFTKVRSLIDGVAGQAALQVGNLVSTTSVLTTVSQLNPIKAYFYISEQEYLALAARARSSGHADLLDTGASGSAKAFTRLRSRRRWKCQNNARFAWAATRPPTSSRYCSSARSSAVLAGPDDAYFSAYWFAS